MCGPSLEDRSCKRDAFVEHLVSTGPPEAFFDNHWDESISWVLVEKQDVMDKTEEPGLGGTYEKVSENLAGPLQEQWPVWQMNNSPFLV